MRNIKFKVRKGISSEYRKLLYLRNAYSIDIEPKTHLIDFGLALNKLDMTVVDMRIVEVLGYCPLGSSTLKTITPPNATPGGLIVLDDLEPGFSYRINELDWPVTVSDNTGWICIGNSAISGDTVEFITNCIAVLGNNDELCALWLKPEYQ